MYHNRFNQQQKQRSFFDVVDEILHQDWKNIKNFGKEFKKEFEETFGKDFIKSTPLVNVIESEAGYKIQVAAPGLQKENFKISLKENRMTIAVNEESTLAEGEKYRKHEFNYGKIHRAFDLPENADLESIEAKYENGVLNVFVAKKTEQAKEQEKEIKIA